MAWLKYELRAKLMIKVILYGYSIQNRCHLIQHIESSCLYDTWNKIYRIMTQTSCVVVSEFFTAVKYPFVNFTAVTYYNWHSKLPMRWFVCQYRSHSLQFFVSDIKIGLVLSAHGCWEFFTDDHFSDTWLISIWMKFEYGHTKYGVTTYKI